MAAAHALQVPAPAERRPEGRAGSRRIFPPQFKLQVLEAYRRDAQCRGNQRATARKFGIHRRQIQKWLQAETTLRAALLRRAPQTASSPPPYTAGSPESARFPSPPPVSIATTTTAAVPLTTSLPSAMPTPMHATLPTMIKPCSSSPVQNSTLPTHHLAALPAPVALPAVVEPIDLSVRRPSPPPAPQPMYPTPAATEALRKPFKLFRPYLLDDEEQRRPAVTSLSSSCTPHMSAFVPVATGCSMAACAPRWLAAGQAFPLR